MATKLGKRELYGGAITVDLPTHLYDVSDRRQVDDAQEVFKDEESNTDEDLQMSYIFDIIDRVAEQDPAKAARFHFEALAEDNDAVEINASQEQKAAWLLQTPVVVPSGLDQALSPPNTPKPIILDGTQTVSKFNKPKRFKVRILLAIYRLSELPHDIVFSLNVPQDDQEMSNEEEEKQKQIREMFETSAQSLRIVDFGLFPGHS